MAPNTPGEDLDPFKEAQKDRLNLKIELDFVVAHLAEYKAGLDRILRRHVDPRCAEIVGKVEFCDYDTLGEAGQRRQISPDLARSILERMPYELLVLSELEAVLYSNQIPVPRFTDDGGFKGEVENIQENDFLTKVEAGELHPSRILVGVSGGKFIWPTPIPSTVCENDHAVLMYQIHVFLHEFFHTVERRLRHFIGMSIEERAGEDDLDQNTSSGLLNSAALFKAEVEGGNFRPISRYSSTYEDTLSTCRFSDPNAYLHALAEEMCETFVAVQLGLVPPAPERKYYCDPNSSPAERVKKEAARAEHSRLTGENTATRLRIMRLLCNLESA